MVHAPSDPTDILQAAPFPWLETHPDPAFVLDRELRVVQVNAALRARMIALPALRLALTELGARGALLDHAKVVLREGRGERFEWAPDAQVVARVLMTAWEDHVLLYLQDASADVRVRRLERLDRVSERLSHTHDPAGVVQAILETAVPLLGAERGAVFTFDRTGERALLAGSVGFTPQLERHYRNVDLTALGEAARQFVQGELLFLDAQALESVLGVRPHHEDPPDMRAVLPLSAGEAQVGALSLTFAPDTAFGPDDLEFMRTVASRCAQALRRAHQARTLRYERERFQKLVEATAHSVWWTGPRGETYQASQSWEAFTGQEEGTSLGDAWLTAIHPQDRERTLREWQAALESRRPYETRYRLRRHDGQYRVMHVRAVPVFDEGAVREWVGMDEDITDRVLAEEQLRTWSLELQKQVRERTADLQRSLDDLRDETDALKAFTAFTEVAGREHDLEALTRRAVEVLVAAIPGSACGYLVPEGDAWMLRASAGASGAELDVRRPGMLAPANFPDVRREGEVRFIDCWTPPGDTTAAGRSALALASVTCDGQPEGLLAVSLRRDSWNARDQAIVRAVAEALQSAVQRGERERALRAKQVQLEALNAELDAFAQTVSHDLRAPVRHVRGFADLALRAMRAGNVDAAERYLQTIQGAAQQANVMIDALLGLGREAQQLPRAQDVDLQRVVRAVQAQLTGDVEGRVIDWQVGALPVVRGDRALLRLVFENLLDNAVKYTRGRDRALIRVSALEEDGWHVIRVHDNGAGFDPRYAHRLFQPFQRLHHDRDFEGNGVGLTSVARIVKRHGGSVEAEGRPGEGATFTVRLPR